MLTEMKDQGHIACMNKRARCSILAVSKPVTHEKTHTQEHGHLLCRSVLVWDATRLSRFCHSRGVGQCLRLLQSPSQRAHKAVPYGPGQWPPTVLSAENCGGSNFITFCLIYPGSLTYPLHSPRPPVPALPAPIFQTHIIDLFWQLGLFSFTFSWQSAGPTRGTSVIADEACICKLPTSHPATCQDIGGSKQQRCDNGSDMERLCLAYGHVLCEGKKVVSSKVWNMRPQLVLGVTHVQPPVRNKESGFFHRGLF